MSRVLITGANGFVGQASCKSLIEAGHHVVACVRRKTLAASLKETIQEPHALEMVVIPDLVASGGVLSDAMQDCDVVLHLADNADRSNRGPRMTEALAQSVVDASITRAVPRLIFGSSIYARSSDKTRQSDYGDAKRRAEQIIFDQAGSAAVSLRFPPVYGPGSRGGIQAIAALTKKGLPIPFGAARAPRDYLALANATSLIVALVDAKADAYSTLAGRSFEPCDGNPISTRDLCLKIANIQGKSARLVPIPETVLTLAAKAVGKDDQVDAAFSSLLCEWCDDLESVLEWSPQQDYSQNLAYLA